jgi:2-hydroxychromene-2-carboxylate isomerase
MATPALYFDLGSPYAYLTFERAPAVLGVMPELRPIVLGPVFVHRGSDSWARGPHRAENIAEIEDRAARYGLPSLRWNAHWPPNTLRAMRTVLWAARRGAAEAVARGAFRAAFVEGRDLGDAAVLRDVVAAAGLDAGALEVGIADRAIKDELKARTTAAIEAGVRGAPVIAVGGTLFYGDDRLEDAAAALRAAA